MVVHWPIEVLPVCNMSNVVILGALHVEVGDPTQLSVDVSVFRHVRVVRHSSSLDLIHFIWVVLPSWFKQYWLFGLELLVEVLSIVSVVLAIEHGWPRVETLIPLVIVRRQHTIVSVLLNDQLGGSFGVRWV